MKKVYIIKQEWSTPEEGINIDICAAYRTLEKAQKALKKIHDEDIEWIEYHGFLIILYVMNLQPKLVVLLTMTSGLIPKL